MAASLLERVLAPDGLSVAFQPIFERRNDAWHLHAFEALVRGPRNTNLHAAEVLFAYARRRRAEAVVDRACLRAIMQTAAPLGVGTHLTLNVHGVTLEQDASFAEWFGRLVERSAFAAGSLTIEIVEHSASMCGGAFTRTLDRLRARGIRVALDDIGLGESNYRMLLDVRPDYFKIDRYLVSGCSHDEYRRAILRSIGALAESVGAHAVAEGVDSVDDLTTLCDDGVSLMQGFLLAEPQSIAALGSGDAVRRATERLPLTPGAAWRRRSNWLHVLQAPASADDTNKAQSL